MAAGLFFIDCAGDPKRTAIYDLCHSKRQPADIKNGYMRQLDVAVTTALLLEVQSFERSCPITPTQPVQIKQRFVG